MYKVMVVEDSKPILRNIVNHIAAIGSDMKIVQTAADGREALEKLKQNRVDILFTDIRMPFLDGLKLIEEAKKLYSSIKCVIISGYDEFEYAKQAIKLQVTEYLLKPIDIDELKKVTDNLISQLNASASQEITNILQELILDKVSTPSEKHSISVCNYSLSLIRAGLLKKGSDAVSISLLRDIMNGLDSSEACVLETGFPCEAVIVFNLAGHTYEDLWCLQYRLLAGMKVKYPQINIIISECLNDIYKLNSQYNNLSNNLSSLVNIGKSLVYKAGSQPELNLAGLHEEASSFQHKLRLLIKNRQNTAFRHELKSCFAKWDKNNYPVIFIKKFVTIILDELHKVFEKPDLDLLTDISTEADRILNGCYSYADIYNNINNYFNSLAHNYYSGRKSSADERFEEIDFFIRSKIYDTITLQDISDKFNLSPSYISRLLKLRLNHSPMDYYMKLKMEEAKKLITSNKNILIKDISDSLGFSDQHYFSKVFKAYLGLSPVDFRNVNRKELPPNI